MGLDKRIVLFFLACLVIYLIPVIAGGQVPETPDEAVYVNGAEHFLSLFSEPATYNMKYGTPAFKLFYQNYLADKGLLLGKYPPGMYILLALFGAVFFFNYYFVVPFFSALTVVVFFYLLKEIYDEKTAWTGAILFSTLPIVWFNASSALADIPNLLFFLSSLLFILKSKGRIMFSVFAGITLGFMVWVKYSSIILLVPAAVLLIDRKNFKRSLITFLVFALMMIPLMMYHQYYYGSPFSTGYSDEPVTQPNSIPWLDSGSFMSLFLHSARFFQESNFSVPFILFSFVCFFMLFGNNRKISWLIAASFFVCLLFFGLIKAVDGIQNSYLTVTSSYHRYLLPVYALMVIPVSVFLSGLKKNNYTLVMFFLLSVNILVVLFAPNFSMSDRIDMAKSFVQDSGQLLGFTDDNSVIMSSNLNKVIYGKRIAYYVGDSNSTELLEDVKKLLKDKHDVYLVMDFSPSEDVQENFLDKLKVEDVFVLNRTGVNVLKIGALES